MVEQGQTVDELLAQTVAITTDCQAKIIAQKFDTDFIIKRINGLCELYYLLTHIVNLPQQDLKELKNLSLVNHKFSVRGVSCEFMLENLFNNNKAHYKALAKVQDANYFHDKAQEMKNKKKSFESGLIHQYMLDLHAKYLPEFEQ